MNLPTWEFTVVVGSAVFGPPLCTAVSTFWAARALPRWPGWVIAPLMTFAAPAAIVLFAFITPATKPDPRSVDGPAYILVTLLGWACIEVPFCFVGALVGVLKARWRRR